MKVLFLDIDGVLNNQWTTERFRGYIGIDPKLAEKVQRIVKETGCSIVLSSTWRLDKEFRDEVRRVVGDFIDTTPDFYGKPRGEEISDWVSKHSDISRYAILDDWADFDEKLPLFRTDPRVGLTDKIMNKVIAYLNEVQEDAAEDRLHP